MNVLTNLLLAGIISCAFTAQASVETYQPNVHYEILAKPVLTKNPTKIEVVDLFWYGCSHCYTFKEKLESWQKNQRDDVYFLGVPAVWQAEMRLHAKAYYSAKALNVFDKIHSAIFDAMNLQNKTLKSESEIADIFITHGIEPKDFSKIFNSGAIEMAVDIAEKKQEKYRLRGTPEIIINGRYRISGRTAGSQSNMLKVASFLIEKERNTSK